MSKATTACVILAGGQARRMGGGDKTLLELAGRSLLFHVLDRLKPQVSCFALSANGPADRFSTFPGPILPDTLPDYPGPLAGLLVGLDWASSLPNIKAVLTIPGDTPFPPSDLQARLSMPLDNGASAAIAGSGGRRHPAVGLWRVDLASSLRRFLVDEQERKVGLWADRVRAVTVEWPIANGVDPFLNINRPEDLLAAQQQPAPPFSKD